LSEVPLGALFGVLAILLVLSAFFSSTETALMSINRYRLRHSARQGHRGAILVERLLRRPDRLIGLVLLGNNFVNILASSLVTLIALRIGGEAAVAAGAGILTLVILVFAEVAPKTLAALHPERLAFPAAYIYVPLLKVTYPLVWLINLMTNGILRLMGVKTDRDAAHTLSKEELRTVVAEAGALIPGRHRDMLVSILDLGKVTVDDIMVPRNEIVGIDLEDDWDHIVEQLEESQHTRLVVYKGDLDNTIGMIHLRSIIKDVADGDLDPEVLSSHTREAYYVPEGTPLQGQLFNFQRARRRVALVVDEYGDIQGLVTMDDILEEIVGEFTTDPSDIYRDVQPGASGSFIVQGSANVRELNRTMRWDLPVEGPKTLNGLILEMMETIPDAGASIDIRGYTMEILQATGNAIRSVRVIPPA
jgi:Mg2+/Co2+ transporter CorB